MIKVALCDDNRQELQHYMDLLTDIAKKHSLKIGLSCFDSGESLFFHYADAPEQVDIIFLDIIMGGMDGMQTARRLRDSGCKAQIVFLTRYADYVYEAFDVNAVQYLLKDSTDRDKLEKVFLKTVELAAKQDGELFALEFDGRITTVPIGQISYFEIWKRLVTVHFGNNQTEKFYSSMEQLENKFAGKGFVRAHRSYLVHLPYIAVFQQKRLQLTTGEIIPVGITYAQPLRQAFSDYVSLFRRV